MSQTNDTNSSFHPSEIPVVIYCRVSTDRQEEDGESLEYQEEKCLQYAKLHNYKVIKVVKEAKSGYIHYSLREQLTLARHLIHDELAKVLIVFDLRRLSRNFVHSAIIFEEIEQAGGSVVSVSENIDNSLTGKLIRSILAWSAESERHKIVEYANRHWQNRLAQGLPMATGRAPYGWDWTDEDKTSYTLNPELAAIRFSLFYMFIDLDMSLRSIAHKLTEDNIPPPSATRNEKKTAKGWYPETIRQMMIDEKNIGTLTICKVTYILSESGKKVARPNKNMRKIPNAMPAIIDAERHSMVLRKLELNKIEKSNSPKKVENFLLRAGYIYCGECKTRMRAATDNKKGHEYHYYQCGYYNNKYTTCNARTRIQTQAVDKLVWEECCHIFERLELIQEVLEKEAEKAVGRLLDNTTANNHILQIETEISYAKEEQKRHTEGSYYYNLITQDIQNKKEQLQKYREEAQKSTPLISRADTYKKRIQNFIDFLRIMKGKYQQADYKEIRNALYILGVKVYINKLPHISKMPHEEYIIPNGKIHITYSPVLTGVQLSKDNAWEEPSDDDKQQLSLWS
ncbi:recombinase family protein [Dictyobacter arantiisoli]|uniref:Serine recombinase n=1 Tax=Dictyobacter arantiisoli TaxID=2014874 RepID=A0A5A5THB8_9CHLR|nr:recombinase family protein [Dictyobacter arantiisoli]GCF10608.1 serine recombinase [Dictyobacter arantiisoli]